jgi:hypothetical protein
MVEDRAVSGRSPVPGSGRSPKGGAAKASPAKPSVPNAKAYAPLGSLTGNARVRPNWRGKLILEVEYNDGCWIGMVYRFTKWRDAKPSDLLPELRIVIPQVSA